jgi:hypothetical protein
MMALGPLVLVVIAVLLYSRRHAAPAARRSAAPGTTRPDRGTTPADTTDLERWTAAGLLSVEQAAAIDAFETARIEREAATEVAPPRLPAVAEALGYLGGVLATVGLVLLVGRSWSDLATPARLALSGGGALALAGGGALVHAGTDAALTRLRQVMWLASTAAAALFAGVLANGGFGADSAEVITLAAASMVALESAVLWWGRALPLQHLTLFGGTVVAIGALAAVLGGDGPLGLSVWAAGGALAVLGLRRRTPLHELTSLLGVVAMLVGSTITAGVWLGPGLLFAVATAAGLAAVATARRLPLTEVDQRVVGIPAAVSLLQVVPRTLGHFAFEAGVITGLAVWLAAGVLLYLATRDELRTPRTAEVLGGAGLIGGAALTGAQSQDFAPLFGLATAVALVALGALPGRIRLSVLGSLGLLINVLWEIGHFFPGEGRAPLLVLVAGALLLVLAVLLTRSGRLGRELRSPPRHGLNPG